MPSSVSLAAGYEWKDSEQDPGFPALRHPATVDLPSLQELPACEPQARRSDAGTNFGRVTENNEHEHDHDLEEYAWPIVREAIREEIEKVLLGAGPR